MGSSAKSSTSRALDYIEHYGVKGMKWGVRRDRSLRGVTSKANDQNTDSIVPDEAAVKARTTYMAIQKDGLASISSEDLRQLIERLTIEENYKKALIQARENAIKEKKEKSILTKIDQGNKSVKIVLTTGKILMDINDILSKTTGNSAVDIAKKAAKAAR